MNAISMILPAEVLRLQSQGVEVLDIRTKEAFSKAHIPKSINIPLSPSFAAWAARVLVGDQPLIVVADHFPIDGVIETLLRAGFVRIMGVLAPFEIWEQSGLPVDQIKVISVNEVADQSVIDVRTNDEWNEGHIAAAIHIQIEEFSNLQMPKNQEIAVICASGNRASIFASLMKKEGYRNVANIMGGMMAWVEAGLPVEK